MGLNSHKKTLTIEGFSFYH